MSTTSKTEFVSSEFDTRVTEDDVDALLSTMDSCVDELRRRIIDDETTESILDPAGSQYLLRSGMSVDNQDPEPLTQQVFIEPVLERLGYTDLRTEISSAASGRQQVADYSYGIDDPRIASEQLLIEAEPMNKKLEDRGHGVDQVEGWLSQREFESDLGFATDGLRWVFVRYDPDSYSHNRLEDISLESVFLELFYNQVGRREPPREALSEASLDTVRDFLRSFERRNFVSIAAEVREVIRETQEEITDEFYDEYIRIVFGVRHGEGERSPRSLVGDGVVPPEDATGEDTRLFAVKLMNRLIFVKFLEDKGLVQPDLLSGIDDIYGEGTGHTRSLYKEFV
ncbi:MAG: hypothetical protein ACLFMT_02790, partial [Halobacteriales archaeon]